MKPEEAPCLVFQRVDVSSSRCLRDEGSTLSENYPLLGGIFSDTKLSWLSRGPVLEVVNTKDGSVIARWTFGAVIKDSSTKVTCVEEYKQPALNRMPQPLLQSLVGLECELTGGMVCVFNFNGPRVLRAINIPSKVSSLALISSGMEATSLHLSLEPMDGIVAVGTKDGHIFLLDLRHTDCQNDLRTGSASHWENLHDELRPCQPIPMRGGGVDQKMRDFPNDHLCLHLNYSAFSHFKRFVVQFPLGDCKQFLPGDSSVTSMLYVPGLSSLIVGFAFGSFQIWSLKTLTHLYTCPTGGGPVERILFQEPCDDPHAFCYLWVSRGSNSDTSSSPSVIMYTLKYNERLWVHECGNVFNNFISCGPGFKFEFDEDDEIVGARVVGMRTIEQPIRTPDDNTLGSSSSTLSLCLIVWETWGTCGPPEGLDPFNTHMVVFDLNQWYVDHMPSRLSARGGVSRNKSIAGYVSKYRLGEILSGDSVDVATLGMLLDVNVDPTSLLPFTTVQNVEEHSRPSALQFRSVALLERQIVHVTHPGIQRALLSTLTSTGPSLLLTPTYVFHQCLALGLRPVQYDVPDCVNVEVGEQRCYVVLVALEHRLTRWLSACARECSDGRMEGAGCTLAWFLNVLWSRFAVLKRTAVQLCVQLFDYSALTLDTNVSRQLRHFVAVSRVLKSVFETVTKEKFHMRLTDSYHIELQKQALDMEVQYYEALQWFVGAGLLPEIPENLCAPEDSHVPYPAKSLIALYTARRTELQELYKGYEEEQEEDGDNSVKDGLVTPPQDLLMIDGLISHQVGGRRLESEWERDAGRTGGLFANMYPPASIQGLLRTYLIRDISYDIKTSIVTYIFMDLAATLDSDKWANNFHRFMQFPSAFNMSPGIIKLTQAFWHLDHQSFEVALEMLLDPLISCLDIEVWQHRSVVRALMLQGQHRLALRYLSAREPPLNSDHDVRMRVNLLLSNDLVHEAFMFQRYFRNFDNFQSLLEYFFKGCAKRQLLSTVLQLTLTEEEEKAFVSFLASSKDVISEDLQVMYLLKRFRYVEAFDVNQKLRKAALESGRAVGSSLDEHGSTRDIVVNALYKTLPGVTRLLATHCAHERSKVGTWKQVKRPTPLSVDVRQCQSDVKLKLPFIETALAKTREAWAKVLPQTPPATDARSLVEQTPFLCTPRTKLFDLMKLADNPLSAKISRKRFREEDIEFSSLPAKKHGRSLLSQAISHQDVDPSVDGSTGVLTPIVKRQSPNSRLRSESGDLGKTHMTPTSIIKSRGSLGLRVASDAPSAIRSDSRRLPYNSLVKSLSALSETPEQTRRIVAKKPPVFQLDFELTDDDDDESGQKALVKEDIPANNSVIEADKSGSKSLISNDSESDNEGSSKNCDMKSFSLPTSTPSPARTTVHKAVSLSNTVVKGNFVTSAASWAVPGNRSSVTFGDSMICVFDKDEPTSTATGSSEISPCADEDSRGTDQDEDLSGSIDGVRDESSRESVDDGNLSWAELRRRCHERVKPRSSFIEDLLNKSFEDNSVDGLKESDLDGSAPKESSASDEEAHVNREESDFDTAPLGDNFALREKVAVTSREDKDAIVEVSDDDSNDTEMLTRKQRLLDDTDAPEEKSEEGEKQESSLLFPVGCALLSPLFRSQLSRKRSVESLKQSTPIVKGVETTEVAAEAQDIPENDDVADIADAGKHSDDSDNEVLGEVSGGIAAESLISNDSEEDEDEEERPASKFWSFLLPSRTPSPVKTPDKRPRLFNRVLMSETLKRCHERVKPRETTVPGGIDQFYARPEDGADVASTSTSERREESEKRVGIEKSVQSADFEVTDFMSSNTSTMSPVAPVAPVGSLLSNVPKKMISTLEVSDDDDSHDGIQEGDAKTDELAIPLKHSDVADVQQEVETVLSDAPAESQLPEEVEKMEQDAEEKDVPGDGNSEEEMGELRIDDSEPENEAPEMKDQDPRDLVQEEEPHTPPNVASLMVASTALRTPRSAKLSVNRDGETPRSDKKSLRRTRLAQTTSFSGVRTRRGEAARPSSTPTRGVSPLEPKKSSPGTGSTTQEEHTTPHRTRSFGPVEQSVEEKPKSARKVRGSSVVVETDVSEGTPRRTRGASLAEEVEVQEGTARKTRGASVAKDVEDQGETPRKVKSVVAKEVEVQGGTARKARRASVAKEGEVHEGTPRKTRRASIAGEIEVQEGTARRTRGASVAKDVEDQRETPRKVKSVVAKEVEEGTARKIRGASVATDVEVLEGTPRKTRGAGVADEVDAQVGTARKTREASVAKEIEVQEGTPRRTRGASVSKEVEGGTPRRTRGASVAEDVEVQEGTPRRTRGASVAKEVEVPESIPRRTKGSSVAKDTEIEERTPRRTKTSNFLKEVSEEDVPVTLSPGSSVITQDISTPRRAKSSGDSNEAEEEHVTPPVTRSHAGDDEKRSTPRQTRSSSVLKESESTNESHSETRRMALSSDEAELKTRGRRRSSEEVNAVQDTSRRTRGSSTSKDLSPGTSRQTRSSRSSRSRRGKTSELDSSFESKDGDTESVYSKKSSASQVNSPDSIASRVRTRQASVSSVESVQKPVPNRKPATRKRKSDESSLILQEKLAQISDSEASVGGTPSKKSCTETSQPRHREGSVVRSIHSEVTERFNRSEHAEPSCPKKALDLMSRDRIEAAIQEYSSTRRLTRKQQALLSRSLEICAQPERFQQAAAAVAVSDVEEEAADDDDGDARSVSSVRSSVRLKRKREGERQPSPSSTATTEILPESEKRGTRIGSVTRRTSGSCAGSPSSIASGVSAASARRRRPSGAESQAQLKPNEERVALKSTTSTEIETSSQASSRKIAKGSRTSSVTLDEDTFSTSFPAEFAEPHYPASEVGSIGNSSPYRESFKFSQPPIEAVEEDSFQVTTPRRSRPTKIAPQPSLGPIQEESQTSTEKDDSSSSKSSSNDKRRSWNLFTPLTEKEIALAAKEQQQQQQKQRKSRSKPTVTSLFSDRKRSEVFKVLLDNDDSDE